MERLNKKTMYLKPHTVGCSIGFFIQRKEFILDKCAVYRVTVEEVEKC